MKKSHPVTKSYHWIGSPVKENAKNVYYNKLQIKTTNAAAAPLEVQLGDKVYLHSAKTDPFIAEIVRLYENRKSGKKKMKASWFYRPSEIDLDSTELVFHPQELFSSNHIDSNEVIMIWDKCSVLYVPHEMVLPVTFKEKNLYFCRYYINREPKIWEVQIIHPSRLLEELKRYQTVISENHRRKIEADKAFWNHLVAEVRKAFHNHANDPSMRIFFQGVADQDNSGNLSSNGTGVGMQNQELLLPTFEIDESKTGLTTVNSDRSLLSRASSLNSSSDFVNRFIDLTSLTEEGPLPLRGEGSRDNDVTKNTVAADSSLLPSRSNHRSNLKFKGLDPNLSGMELAIELFKQEQFQKDPRTDLSLYTTAYFMTGNRQQLLSKYQMKIDQYRLNRRKQMAGTATSNVPSASSSVSPLLLTTVNPTDAILAPSTASPRDAGLPANGHERSRDEENPEETEEEEREEKNTQESWLTESDEEKNPRLAQAALTSPFLKTNEGKIRKEAKKRKRQSTSTTGMAGANASAGNTMVTESATTLSPDLIISDPVIYNFRPNTGISPVGSTSRRSRLKFKNLDLNLSDLELAIELFKQDHLRRNPFADMTHYTPDYFMTDNRQQLLAKFQMKIDQYRYRQTRKPQGSTSTIARVRYLNNGAQERNITPVNLNGRMASNGHNRKQNEKYMEDSEEEEKENRHNHTLESWITESEEEERNPRLSQTSATSPFLKTNEGKIRKQVKKRLRSNSLSANPNATAESLTSPSVSLFSNRDDQSESSTDPEEDYFEDEQAEIPPLRENIDPMEHRTILLQSGQQRLVYDFPFPTDYYEILAYEEITRIKLDFVNSLSKKALHGSRDSRTISIRQESLVLHSYENTTINSNGSTRSSLYGQSRPTVDGSLIFFRGEIQEVILDALLQSDHSITAALKSLHQVVRPRLLVWTAEEQRIIHFHFYSKEARDLSKLRRQLKNTKTIKDILDYKSRFISGPRAFEAGYFPPAAETANRATTETEKEGQATAKLVLVEAVTDRMEVSAVEISRFNSKVAVEQDLSKNSIGENEPSSDDNHRSDISNDDNHRSNSDEEKKTSEEAVEDREAPEEIMKEGVTEEEGLSDYHRNNNNFAALLGGEEEEYYYSEENSDHQQSSDQLDEDFNYYWAPVETINNSQPKRSLRLNSINARYAKSVIASYLEVTKGENLLLKFRELFDDYSVHQFQCAFYIWSQNVLSPAEFLVRIIHILQNAIYIHNPLRQEEISLTAFQSQSEALTRYLETSQQMKYEFYKYFCQLFPVEMREDIVTMPLFPPLSLSSCDNKAVEIVSTTTVTTNTSNISTD